MITLGFRLVLVMGLEGCIISLTVVISSIFFLWGPTKWSLTHRSFSTLRSPTVRGILTPLSSPSPFSLPSTQFILNLKSQETLVGPSKTTFNSENPSASKGVTCSYEEPSFIPLFPFFVPFFDPFCRLKRSFFSPFPSSCSLSSSPSTSLSLSSSSPSSPSSSLSTLVRYNKSSKAAAALAAAILATVLSNPRVRVRVRVMIRAKARIRVRVSVRVRLHWPQLY
jgi:hypothetical protein